MKRFMSGHAHEFTASCILNMVTKINSQMDIFLIVLWMNWSCPSSYIIASGNASGKIFSHQSLQLVQWDLEIKSYWCKCLIFHCIFMSHSLLVHHRFAITWILFYIEFSVTVKTSNIFLCHWDIVWCEQGCPLSRTPPILLVQYVSSVTLQFFFLSSSVFFLNQEQLRSMILSNGGTNISGRWYKHKSHENHSNVS